MWAGADVSVLWWRPGTPALAEQRGCVSGLGVSFYVTCAGHVLCWPLKSRNIFTLYIYLLTWISIRDRKRSQVRYSHVHLFNLSSFGVQVTCLACDHRSNTVEPFWDLSLEFPERYHSNSRESAAQASCHLTEMLAKFTETEALEGNIYACDHCNSEFSNIHFCHWCETWIQTVGTSACCFLPFYPALDMLC